LGVAGVGLAGLATGMIGRVRRLLPTSHQPRNA
jgi:hypothetical protein